MSEQLEAERFEKLLEYLRQARGFDFTAYKRTSLHRRTMKRMQAVGVQNFDDYVDYLELHPGCSTPSSSTSPRSSGIRTSGPISIRPFSPSCSMAAMPRRRFASGARDAQPARRHIRWRCCWPSDMASRRFAIE